MVIGIGIDLCEVERMRRTLETGDGFLARYFTEAEQAYIHERGKKAAESLAGCFAAKEAVLKAIGCGIVVPLREVEVTHDALGAPSAHLTGAAKEKMEEAGGKRLHLSITHTDDMAAAVAILEGE